jgi:hypothetical protein
MAGAYYKKNARQNQRANVYGEANRGRHQNQASASAAQNKNMNQSISQRSPLDVAREEDCLESELGYDRPDDGQECLGWLVNASAVRISRVAVFFDSFDCSFFSFGCFIVSK